MINRNNYEEYFLLLADNELPAEEAALVKRFAAQHPDLAEELHILMSCRLEDISLPVFPKEKLLRTTLWNSENPEPVQTQMLLMLDGELAATEKQQLQEEIAVSTVLQTEWKTLQQTKLVAEVIAHPDKELLRHTNRVVRPLLWMRWAAAAAVVAGLGWLLWLQQEPQIVAPAATIASNNTPKQPANTALQATVSTDPATEVTKESQPSSIATYPTATTKPAAIHQQADTRGREETVLHRAAKNNGEATARSDWEDPNAEPDPVTVRLSSTDASLTAVNTRPVPTPQVAQLSARKITLPVLAGSPKLESFTGSKSDLPAEEDDYVTIGGAHVNKQKMRGLFRNVTRTVARSFTKSKMEPDVYATR